MVDYVCGGHALTEARIDVVYLYDVTAMDGAIFHRFSRLSHGGAQSHSHSGLFVLCGVEILQTSLFHEYVNINSPFNAFQGQNNDAGLVTRDFFPLH